MYIENRHPSNDQHELTKTRMQETRTILKSHLKELNETLYLRVEEVIHPVVDRLNTLQV
jgi:hypothetical protein